MGDHPPASSSTAPFIRRNTSSFAVALSSFGRSTSAASNVTTTTESHHHDDYPSTRDSYELICEIGSGAYAKVFQAKCVPLNVHVAIKVIELDQIVSSLDEVTSEVRTLMLIRDNHVLGAHASFTVGSALWLVMPLMKKGSVLRIMTLRNRKSSSSSQTKSAVGLPEPIIAIIGRELLKGLQYIHSQGQIHRDIKASNLLVNSDGQVALSDFGVSGWLNGFDRRENRKTFVGTPCWMAPEVMEHQNGYDEKADIWSVGITLLEMAKGRAPYAHLQPLKVLMKTLKEPAPSLKSYDDYKKGEFSKQFSDIISLCLEKDPNNRPSAVELLGKSFFKQAKPIAYLQENLLQGIQDVDADGISSEKKASTTDKIELSTGKGFVHGSTWVFDDDSTTSTTNANPGMSSTSASNLMQQRNDNIDKLASLMEASGLPGEE